MLIVATGDTVSTSDTSTNSNDLNDDDWIAAYFIMHRMSHSSYRYAYFLWVTVVLVFFVFSIFHAADFNGSFCGAYLNRWALRRTPWRGKYFSAYRSRAQPTSLPPNGQLLSIIALLIVTLALTFIGPDYTPPSNGLFDFSFKPPDGKHNPAPCCDILDYTIPNSWWTSGSRTGIIAFALLPLCVLFAIKAPPFAVFALPFTAQIHFDKLTWLHRLSGGLIWFLTSIHVVLWSVQLLKDQRAGTETTAYHLAWRRKEFVYGWIAFVLLTLIAMFSVGRFRKAHYDTFYTLHIVLVPSALIASALHHPDTWWWCWTALGLWVGERVWRATWYIHLNGFFVRRSLGRSHGGGPIRGVASLKPSTYLPPIPTYHLVDASPLPTNLLESYTPPPGYAHAELLSGATVRLTYIPPGCVSWAPGQHFLINIPSISSTASHPFTVASVCDEQASTNSALVFLIRCKNGWTRRLWELVGINCSGGGNYLLEETLPPGTAVPRKGVLLKMFIDGPFGSTVRTRWGSHSTILIIVGGSGASFGVSLLEYACLCLAEAARGGREFSRWRGQGEFLTNRVRFIWLIREFAHIQWCASAIRRCMSMLPSPGLDVQIFVTNYKPSPEKGPTTTLESEPFVYNPSREMFQPPSPQFARHQRDISASSMDSVEGRVNSSPMTQFEDQSHDPDLEGIPDILIEENLTDFEGDNEIILPGEDLLNQHVKNTGKAHRAASRKLRKQPPTSCREGEDHTPPKPRTYHYSRVVHSRHGSADALLDRHDPELCPKLPQEHRTPPTVKRVTEISTAAIDEHAIRIQYPPLVVAHPSPRAFQQLGAETSGGEISPLTSHQLENNEHQPRLDVEEQELNDVLVVSEYARPGKPRIHRIVGDEVRGAEGSVIVACCGPTSLNVMVRKAISAEIDPSRIFRGDHRQYIELVSEEFE